MRKVTITYNLYTYDELSDDAKENAKQWYLQNCRKPFFFTEDVEQDLENLFGENNFDVQYQLSYCQGDGLNIFGSVAVSNVIKFVKEHQLNERSFDSLYNILTDEEMDTILLYSKETDGIALHQNIHDCYCMAEYIEFTDEWEEQLEWAIENDRVDYKSINTELIEKFEQLVKDIFHELCNMYADWGYQYFYEVSDEEMTEVCKANNFEFLEDGTIY